MLQLRPQLRPEIRFSVESHGATPCCVLEDPVRENFWRIGITEFRFISQLDGQRTLPEAIAAASPDSQTAGLTTADAERILHWLAGEDLLANVRKGDDAARPAPSFAGRVGNLIFLRWPLGNPQTLLEKLYPWLGFVTSPGFALVWLAAVLAAVTIAAGNWQEFQESSIRVIAPGDWWHFVAIWWGLKAIHELFHGLTCLRYGGQVRETGILFILLAPLGAYVDVTSSWRFESKWRRIHVIVAGIYAELFVAAVAVIVWTNAHDPAVRQLCLQTVVLATVATVFFNSNPLIRFDGYYLLSDLLELPNLYQRGQLALRRLVARVFLGPVPESGYSENHFSKFVLFYGIAAWLWRVLLCAGILIASSALLGGAGLLLSAAALVAWVVLPLLRGALFSAQLARSEPMKALRATGLLLVVASLGFVVLNVLTIPDFLVIPGVVRPARSTLVRCGAPGQIVDLRVMSGQTVTAGQVLGRLRNPELDLRIQQATHELERIEQRRRMLNREDRIAEELAEIEVADYQQQQLDILLSQKAKLTITAPHQGLIIDFDLSHLADQYVERGTPLFHIAEMSPLEFWFSGRQDQIDNVRRQLQDEAVRSEIQSDIFVAHHAPIRVSADCLTLAPSATRELAERSLSAVWGGSIAMTESRQQDGQHKYQTVGSRIGGTALLRPETRLVPGTRGTIRITLERRTLLAWIQPWIMQKWSRVSDQVRGNQFFAQDN